MNIKEKLIKNICKNHNFLDKEGSTDTYIDDIKLFRITCNEQIMPLVYQRGFIFIVQGTKTGYIGKEQILNTPEKYMMITSPQPLECGTCAKEKNSLIGLYINLDLSRLNKIVNKYNEQSFNNRTKNKNISSVILTERTDEIEDVYFRILKALQDSIESKMLCDELLNELYFRILQDKYGFILQELCEQDSSFSKISKIVELIHSKIEEDFSIDEMAKLAGMSSSTFHKLFKKALHETPVQYVKKLRLDKARQLILHENMKAIEASEKVGYNSPTQFNREFKRYFGVTPSKINELGYSNF